MLLHSIQAASPLITESAKLAQLIISVWLVWIPAFPHLPVASKWEISTIQCFHKHTPDSSVACSIGQKQESVMLWEALG